MVKAAIPTRRSLVLASLLCVVASLAGLGAFTRFDAALTAQRMAWDPHVATGDVVFVTIDKYSLDEIGVWPWDRNVYARVIDILAGAQARDIFLDVDFSARSSADGDAALSQALEAAGGGVLLPSFTQYQSTGQPSDATAVTAPNEIFADHAWTASVSIRADGDGLIRKFPYGEMQGDEFVMSVPAAVAGVADPHSGPFVIDFSIAPSTVPRYSLIDVVSGRIDPSAFADKIVMVGATAIELKDNFFVPVHGLVSGPMVQIIATETLLQNRVLTPLSTFPLLLVAGLVGFAALSSRGRLRLQSLGIGTTVIGLEAAAFWLQSAHALILPTVSAHALLAMVVTVRVLEELDLRTWLLRLASVDADNSRNLLGQVISDSADAILVVDEDGLLVEHSTRLTEMLAGGAAMKNGDSILHLLPDQWQADIARSIDDLRNERSHPAALNELELDDGDGRLRTIEYSITASRLALAAGKSRQGDDHVFVACITARDITERRQQEERIGFLSRHDVLTGALRSSAFVTEINDKMTVTPPAGTGHAVYAVNLHRFKTINATLGRAKGDGLLKAVVRRLSLLDGRLSAIARLGGDTFAAFTTIPVSETEARSIAEAIVNAVSAPFDVTDAKAQLGVHIGMVFHTEAAQSQGAALVAEAELALDEARRTNGSGLVKFDPESGARHAAARRIEADLWHALGRDELRLFYQPQVRLSDGKIIGAEALLRWRHPELGFISPQVFVEIAEANGYIEQLGAWAMLQACRDAMTFRPDLAVAVNVSPLQLQRGDIVATVRQALRQTGLRPDRLQIEITESTFLNPSDEMLGKLSDLKALGVSIALDDFGTGYSSFGYLARFPLDKIKVDQMFVRTLIDNKASQAIVQSVKTLCRGLGIAMICEGIETEAEAAILRRIGCEQGQGYLFGRPQPAEDLIRLADGENVPLAVAAQA
ncbi:MAG: EAL domain-containing protein [Rhizobium sp.]|nr:EAL domain-containing protein [Rhizobium sp.]